MEEIEPILPPELIFIIIVVALIIALVALVVLYFKYNNLKKAQKGIYNYQMGNENTPVMETTARHGLTEPQPAVIQKTVISDAPTPINESAIQNKQVESTSNQLSADELDDHIFELYRRFEIPPGRYLWPQENLRWRELVFCLLKEIGSPEIHPDNARSVTDMLGELGLLQITLLAEPVSESNSNTIAIKTIMARKGYSEEQVKKAVISLNELANSFIKKYDGKVQKYLRFYGQRMIDELGTHFKLSQLSDSDVQNVFTLWLQNVSNMPIGLTTPSVQSYCAKHNVKYEDLLEAADRHDINIALVDDLIAEYIKGAELTEP